MEIDDPKSDRTMPNVEIYSKSSQADASSRQINSYGITDRINLDSGLKFYALFLMLPSPSKTRISVIQ